MIYSIHMINQNIHVEMRFLHNTRLQKSPKPIPNRGSCSNSLVSSKPILVKMEGKRSYNSELYSRLSIFIFLSYLLTYLILGSSVTSGTPTVKPYDKFDLEKDTETIHTISSKLPGNKHPPDNDRMVRMFCHRSREQRIKMKEKFKEKYDGFAIEGYCAYATNGESSFRDLLDDIFNDVLGLYRDHLHWELTSILKRTDKESIVEILLSISPEQRDQFYSNYNDTFRSTVQKHIEGNLKEDFHNIALEIANRARRPDIPSDKINWNLAKEEAQHLFDERKKWKNHRCELDKILLETPIQQLNATFVEFKKIADGKEIEEVLDKHMEKDKRGSYKSMVFFAKNKHDYYARRIQKAMKGWGTKDHVLNRIISIHCEEDLKEIATAFQLNTADSLIHALEDETSGHHEMLLTCLAGKYIEKERF